MKHLLQDSDGPICDTPNGRFQRLADGSVQIEQGGTVQRLAPDTWALVVASVSARGEGDPETYQEALTFHMRRRG